jgi:hypothetical protein
MKKEKTKKDVAVVDGPHVCVFDKEVSGSEVQTARLHMGTDGKWQTHVSKAVLCACGNQQNITTVHYFKTVTK